MSYPLRTAAAVTALGLAGAAVWSFSGGSDAGSSRKPVTLGRIANVALTTDHDCTELLAYYRAQAARVVGPYGLDGDPQLYRVTDMMSDSMAAKAMTPSAAGP